jgi:hypothetical protein
VGDDLRSNLPEGATSGPTASGQSGGSPSRCFSAYSPGVKTHPTLK